MKKKMKTISINGVKTNVVLPRGMKSEEVPNIINTHSKTAKGLIFQV